MQLSDLKTGEKGVIVRVHGHGSFRKRIVEMGFIKGNTVEVILNAPLRDPVEYKILGYKISLRRDEARMIDVVSEEEARQQAENMNEANNLQGLTCNEDDLLHRMKSMAEETRKTITVALVGNPNCGKTSLFNIASGSSEHVGNYSGVTVEAKTGHFDYKGYRINLVDLPGTYSLTAYSPEELYVREHIIEKTPDVIVNVIDASNLERNLYLTTQLIDMNIQMVGALNMYDDLEKSGSILDYQHLSVLLGVPLVPTVARTGKGIDKLFDMVIEIYEHADDPVEDKKLRQICHHIHVNHGPVLEASIDKLKVMIQKDDQIRYKYSTRFLAIKLLENDADVEKIVSSLPNGTAILAQRDKEEKSIKEDMQESSESAITDAKYGFIEGALKETYKESPLEKERTTSLIDKVVTNRIWGFPIFFVILYIIFQGTFTLGQYPMDGIDWLVAKLGEFIATYMPDGSLKDMLIDGVIGGVGAVIVFLPNILILYFFISLLEDSGYMARAAFIMDKIMHKMGLHGKSFIPMIMGFGCNVPAIMASRTVESPRSRLVTMLVTPLMSCSARLPLYLILTGAFFPKYASLVMLCLYALGILMAVVLARVFSKVFMKGEDTPFVMELPPYRLPTAKAILRHTWEKGKQYLQKMGGIILLASIIVWFLGHFPRQAAETQEQQQENSYIGRIGHGIEPVIKPLGFDWKLGISLLTGVGAKELVVSTLGVLYSDQTPKADEQKVTSSGEEIQPGTENTEDDDNAGLQQALSKSITPLTAVSYMVFVLFYFPCIATIAAIKNESGSWKYALFAVFYTTCLAWIMSFIVYNIGNLFIH